MNTHRVCGRYQHERLLRSWAVAKRSAVVCVSLPNQDGIPTYSITGTSEVIHGFGIAVQDT